MFCSARGASKRLTKSVCALAWQRLEMSYLEAKNPGRWGYLIARFLALTGVVAVAGSLVLALYIFISRPTAGSLKLLTLPGTTTVSLEKSGLYNLYFDFMWTE